MENGTWASVTHNDVRYLFKVQMGFSHTSLMIDARANPERLVERLKHRFGRR